MSVSETAPIAGGRMPTNCGWFSGNPSRLPPVAGEAQTGSRCFSASATAASQPPLVSMSGPATSTGLRAASSVAASCDERCGVGRDAAVDDPSRRVAGPILVGLDAPVVHRDRDEHRPARRQRRVHGSRAPARPGRPRARGGSCAHFTYGCGPTVGSRLVRFASIMICGRTCWPAVITSGDLFAWALKIPPTALPTPGAVWRLTCVGRPLACAKPSAIPTTASSWSPSTYVKSSGKSASIGSSVEPGLPKIVVIPWARNSSKVASRTVGIGRVSPLAFDPGLPAAAERYLVCSRGRRHQSAASTSAAARSPERTAPSM